MSPTESLACSKNSNSTVSSCTKDADPKHEKKGCCDKGHSEDDSKSCEGKCGNSCYCPATYFNVSQLSSDTIPQKISFFQKSIFYHQGAYISSGFYSIWHPPRLG